MFKVTYQNLVYTTVAARTSQRACRAAFAYWINTGKIKRQPPTSNDWTSSFEGVEVERV